MPSRTVEVAAADLPAYIAGLPRLLMEHLTIKVSGNLNEHLEIASLYGSGHLWIEGDGNCTWQKGVWVSNCSITVSLRNLAISGHSGSGIEGIRNAIIYVNNSRCFTISDCTISGFKSADSETEIGVRADEKSNATMADCGISDCGIAVITVFNSVVSIHNRTGGIFANNDIGPYAYYGGIILLSESTPELLGGATSVKSGSLIVKGDGTLL